MNEKKNVLAEGYYLITELTVWGAEYRTFQVKNGRHLQVTGQPKPGLHIGNHWNAELGDLYAATLEEALEQFSHLDKQLVGTV